MSTNQFFSIQLLIGTVGLDVTLSTIVEGHVDRASLIGHTHALITAISGEVLVRLLSHNNNYWPLFSRPYERILQKIFVLTTGRLIKADEKKAQNLQPRKISG